VTDVGDGSLPRSDSPGREEADVAALGALVLVTAIWGITFVQIKDALALYPLFAFLAVRFAIAVAVLAVPAGRRLPSLGKQGGAAGAGLGLLLAAGYALQTAGLDRTTVSAAGFVTGMYVILTPVFGLALFRIRPDRAVWLGVALAVIGLAMLSGVAAGSVTGDLLVLCAAALYALQIALMERFAPRFDPLAFTTAEMIAAFVASRDRRRCWAGRDAARRNSLGGAGRDGNLRQRIRLPRPGVGAATDERHPNGARLRARARVRRHLRLCARGRSPRRGRLGGLRREPVRHRGRRARGGGNARAPRARAEKRLTAVALALTSAALFGGMTVAVRLGFAREGDAGLHARNGHVALAVAVVAALVAGPHDVVDAWPYSARGPARAGRLAAAVHVRDPQRRRVEDFGRRRAAPLVAVTIAFIVLGEPVSAPARGRRAAIVAEASR
jgi:drug/metabolite transporter (DMT)-like permease